MEYLHPNPPIASFQKNRSYRCLQSIDQKTGTTEQKNRMNESTKLKEINENHGALTFLLKYKNDYDKHYLIKFKDLFTTLAFVINGYKVCLLEWRI